MRRGVAGAGDATWALNLTLDWKGDELFRAIQGHPAPTSPDPRSLGCSRAAPSLAGGTRTAPHSRGALISEPASLSRFFFFASLNGGDALDWCQGHAARPSLAAPLAERR